MTAPSLIRAARAAPDRHARIRLMAETMRLHRAGPEEACTFHHLTAAGFTTAEVEAYRDDARAILSDRPRITLAPIPGRMEGDALVRVARRVRRRLDAAQSTGGVQ